MPTTGPYAIFDDDQDIILEGPVLFASVKNKTTSAITDVTAAARRFQSESGNYLEHFPSILLPNNNDGIAAGAGKFSISFWYINLPNLAAHPDDAVKLTGRCIAASYAAKQGCAYKDVSGVIRAQQAVGKHELPCPRKLFADSESAHDGKVLRIWYS